MTASVASPNVSASVSAPAMGTSLLPPGDGKPSLEEHFTTIASAPNGIKKLRELILELAVRGKLIPQNPDDEAAADLLERVKAETARLMAAGAVKKEKPLSSVDQGEAPFLLPTGWAWARVGDTGQYINGLAFKPEDWGDTGRPIIRIQNLSGRNSEFNRTQREVDDSVIVRPGDILVSWSATLDAYFWEGAEEGVLNQHIFRVIPNGLIAPPYLFWLLKAAIQEMREGDHAHGLVMTHINRGPFLSHVVAIPPEDEQIRIANRIEELMALCDQLEAQQADAEAAHEKLVRELLATLTQSQSTADFQSSWQRLATHFDTLFTTETSIDVLKNTILQLAVMGRLVSQGTGEESGRELLNRIFSERVRLAQQEGRRRLTELPAIEADEVPYELPKGWAWARLGEVGLSSTGGTPASKNPIFFGGELPFIGPGQINLDGQIYEAEKWITEAARTEVAVAMPGDILMVCIGGSIGKSAIADREVAFNQQINSMRVVIADREFVFLSVIEPRFQREVRASATGSATPIINRTKWENLIIPLPPLEEQRRIVAKVDDLLRLCDRLRDRLEKLDRLAEKLGIAIIECVCFCSTQ